MSQPPSARPSPTGSPAVRPQAINLEGIYTNIPILINRVRNNQLATNQIQPLRNLIANHAKDIIIFHARLGRQNPLLNLPDVLNPTKKVNGYDAMTTEATFLGQIHQGIAAARSIRPDQALIAAMHAKQQAARQTQARPPAAAATGSPAPTEARASPQPQQPAMSVQQVRELIALPIEERNKRLDADPALKARFVASYQFYQRRSAQVKQAGTPGAGSPAVRPAGAAASAASTQPSSQGTPVGSPAPAPATPTVASGPSTPTVPNAVRPPGPPAGMQGSQPAPGAPPGGPNGAQQAPPTTASPAPTPGPAGAAASPAPPGPPRPPVTPSAPSTPATPTLPHPPQPSHQGPPPSAAAPPHPPQPIPSPAPPPPPVVIPQRPPSPPRPPPPPPEPEPQRRRRKLREYMREQAPDLSIELGMDDLFSEVLDNLVETAARDSVRLAAHRNSGRVELKDMAFVLEQYHDIMVPGFNVQVPKRVHVEQENGKRARVVVPRARKKDDE